MDNPDNPSNPIIIADGSNTDGIHLKEDSIFVSVKPEDGKNYNYYDYIQNEKGILSEINLVKMMNSLML